MTKTVVSEADRDVSLDKLCRDSIELVEYARRIAASQINLVQLMTFYSIGRWIVEVQQQGEKRAKYGKQVIKKLSESLTARFGREIHCREIRDSVSDFGRRITVSALFFALFDSLSNSG